MNYDRVLEFQETPAKYFSEEARKGRTFKIIDLNDDFVKPFGFSKGGRFIVPCNDFKDHIYYDDMKRLIPYKYINMKGDIKYICGDCLVKQPKINNETLKRMIKEKTTCKSCWGTQCSYSREIRNKYGGIEHKKLYRGNYSWVEYQWGLNYYPHDEVFDLKL